MNRIVAAAGAALALLCASASAQTPPNPVMEHFRAYRAALQSGDLAAAENEAAAALAASEQRDGDGGRTAVLAYNLVMTKLMRGDGAGAVQPAQRVLALAQGGAQGVTVGGAQLLLARAQLDAGDEGAAARVETGLADASLGSGDKYPAAVDLGTWALAHQQYDRAQSAWHVAVATSEASPYGADFGSGVARTFEAVALVAGHRNNLTPDLIIQAHDLYTQAKTSLRPLAQQAPLGPAPNMAQQSLATAIAWHGLLRAKLMLDHNDALERAGRVDAFKDDFVVFGADPAHPACELSWHSPSPIFSGAAAMVVFRAHLNAQGEVTESSIVASAGDEQFRDAVSRVFPRWTAERAHDQPADCALERTMFVPVTFVPPSAERSPH